MISSVTFNGCSEFAWAIDIILMSGEVESSRWLLNSFSLENLFW